jgi:hypothetical protein
LLLRTAHKPRDPPYEFRLRRLVLLLEELRRALF